MKGLLVYHSSAGLEGKRAAIAEQEDRALQQKKGGDASASPPPITRLPDYPITRLPDYPITRLLNLVPREGLFGFHEVLHLAFELQLLRRRRRRRRRLVRRDVHVAVELEARARRDQTAHRHVFLQAA